MQRIRVFIGVELSGSVVARAEALVKQLRPLAPEANWLKTIQMHLTLKFMGNVTESEAVQICQQVALASKKVEPFEIGFRGLGAFPSLEEPSTLWIGVNHGRDELTELLNAIETQLQDSMGFPKERRKFHPHVTLGRLNQTAKADIAPLMEAIPRFTDYDADLTVIDEVVTFASFLSRTGGPEYEALGRAELAP